MKTKILGLLVVGLLAVPLSASALTYDFTVNGGPTGPFTGVTSTGYFTFDQSIIPPGGGNVSGPNLLTDLDFSWNGISYDETNANTGELTFDALGNLTSALFGNNCVGGICIVNTNTNQWFISHSNFAYAILGVAGIWQGTVTIELRQPAVPEPGTLALLGLGLAGLGLSRRRKA